jgi:ankyrin repeat protein
LKALQSDEHNMPTSEPSEQSHAYLSEEVMAKRDRDGPYWNLKPESALLQAAKDHSLDAVTNLLEKGVGTDTRDEKGWTSLHHAAKLGSEELESILLQKGASPNSQDNEGAPPLFHATGGRHIEVVSLLLINGVEVDLADEDGWTPLMAAVERASSR